MSLREALTIIAGILVGATLSSVIAYAWTGPTGAAPSNNVSAPINVGASNQTKNGGLGVNALSVFGNALLSSLGVGTGRYLNFDYTNGGTSGTGASGYGIRDNAGTLEFKNSGGTWASIQNIVSTMIGASGQWATSGSNIYYNGGSVGVGTASPGAKLDVGNGASSCCAASQTPNISLDQASNSNGQMAWLQFHNAGESEAYIRLAGGGTGVRAGARRLEVGDSQSVGTGLTASGEITGTLGAGYGQLRMVAGNYGAMWRNDGANTYFLLTAAGDQYGIWNGLRPLIVNDVTGAVTIATSLTFPDGTTQTSATPAATTVGCTIGGNAGACTTPDCPAGYVRSGCSLGNGNSAYISVGPSGAAGCTCNDSHGAGALVCTTFCVK